MTEPFWFKVDESQRLVDVDADGRAAGKHRSDDTPRFGEGRGVNFRPGSKCSVTAGVRRCGLLARGDLQPRSKSGLCQKLAPF